MIQCLEVCHGGLGHQKRPPIVNESTCCEADFLIINIYVYITSTIKLNRRQVRNVRNGFLKFHSFRRSQRESCHRPGMLHLHPLGD